MIDKTKIVYEQPSVEIISVEVERGFADSLTGGDINDFGNGPGYIEDLLGL